jgi:hypothetical protein
MIPKRDDRSRKTTELGRPRTQRPGYDACQVSNQMPKSDLELNWKVTHGRLAFVSLAGVDESWSWMRSMELFT